MRTRSNGPDSIYEFESTTATNTTTTTPMSGLDYTIATTTRRRYATRALYRCPRGPREAIESINCRQSTGTWTEWTDRRKTSDNSSYCCSAGILAPLQSPVSDECSNNLTNELGDAPKLYVTTTRSSAMRSLAPPLGIMSFALLVVILLSTSLVGVAESRHLRLVPRAAVDDRRLMDETPAAPTFVSFDPIGKTERALTAIVGRFDFPEDTKADEAIPFFFLEAQGTAPGEHLE